MSKNGGLTTKLRRVGGFWSCNLGKSDFRLQRLGKMGKIFLRGLRKGAFLK